MEIIIKKIQKNQQYYFRTRHTLTHTHTNYFCTLQIIINKIYMHDDGHKWHTQNSSISTIATTATNNYIFMHHLGEDFLHILFLF